MGKETVFDKASGIAMIESGVTWVVFQRTWLGNSGAKEVAAVLKGCKTLEILKLDGNQIGNAGASSLADALTKNQTLSKLHLDSNQIGDVGASSLAEALEMNQTLSELYLDNNQIGDVGVSSLADALKKNQTLSTLHLRHNQFGDRGAKSLAAGLLENQNLKDIHIVSDNINDSDALLVVNALKGKKQIESIGLGGEKITHAVATAMADVLKSNAPLGTLSFLFTQICDVGASSIAKAIKENKTLQRLLLSSNRITDVGVSSLADALKTNQTLHQLNLSNNNITDVGASALTDVLKTSQTLHQLNLSNNNITDVGASSLANVLKTTQTLHQLNLSGNNITDVGASSLSEALKTNQTLCNLHLEFNPINDESLTDAIYTKCMQNTDELDGIEEATWESLFDAALDNGDLQEWGRAKLMVIGESGAGKTSTVRSLLGIAPVREHVSTVGVDLKVTRTEDWTERSASKSDYERFLSKAVAERKKNGGRPKVEVKKKVSVTKSVRESMRKSFSWMSRAKSRKSLPVEDIVPSKDAPLRLKDVAKRMDIKDLKALTLRMSSNADMSFSIWDYGGQEVFYALHHIFLSRQGVYLLVFDMTRILKLDEKAIEFVSFWMNSVKLHAPEAPVVMVGTRGDQMNITSDLEKVNRILRENVTVLGVLKSSLVQNGDLFFFPMDNNKESRHRGIELRKAVEAAALGLKCVKKLVPLAWMQILDYLIEANNHYLTIYEVFHICENFGVSKIQAKEMLGTFHDLGVLVHQRATERLYEKVVIQPQWLLDKLSCVINDERHSKELISDSKLRDVQGDLIEYRRSGVATRMLLEVLWEEEEVDFLIDFMKETMLMCDFNVESGEKKYLVTSLMVQDQLGDTWTLDLSDFEGGLTCLLDFSEFFLPKGVFQRLVSTCASVSSEEVELGHREAIVYIDDDPVALVESRDRISIQLMKNPEDAPSTFMKLFSMVEEQKALLMENLVWKLLLQSPSDEAILVDYKKVVKARQSGSQKVKPETARQKVTVSDFDVFGRLDEDQPTPPHVARSSLTQLACLEHDVFISHKQQTGGDIAAVLAMKLESRGLRVWYDMSTEGNLGVPAMKEGVKASKLYLLLLTKDVFESNAVKMELETALRLGKPIRLVHESQTNMAGFATFSEYIAGFEKFITEMESCPANAKKLFEEEESMPYQRRKYLADPFIDELVKRIRSAK